jgi:Ran GTPase-activating protein (RanGAP) involved in mRNA processing and transport
MLSFAGLLEALEKELPHLLLLPRCKLVYLRRVSRRMHQLVRGFPAEVKSVQWHTFTNGSGFDDISPVVQFFSVQSLTLCHAKLGPEGTDAFAGMLGSMPELRKLNLSRNGIGKDAPMKSMGVQPVLLGMPSLVSLSCLNLNVNHLGPEAAALLAGFLKTNPQLLTLEVTCNPLGPGGGTSLAEALVVNTVLETLCCDTAKFGGDGASRIFQAMFSNSSLKRLDMRDNMVHQAPPTTLGRMLELNTTLTHLDLRSNYLTPEQGRVICQSLYVNSSLHKLDLRNHCFDHRVHNEFVDWWRFYNKTLEIFVLNFSEWDLADKRRALARPDDELEPLPGSELFNTP